MKAETIYFVRSSERVAPLLARDASIHLFVLAYGLGGLVLSYATGRPDKFIPFARALDAAPAFVIAAILLGGGWTLRSGEPFAALRRAARCTCRPGGISAILLLLSLCLHVGIFVSIKTNMTDINPFFADRMLADLDEAIHGVAPWQITQALIPASLTTMSCVLYFAVWGLLWQMSLMVCVLFPRLAAVRAQYLWTYLLTFLLLGNVCAIAGMSAGPIYYAGVTGDEVRFSGLTASLDQWLPAIAAGGVKDLWAAYTRGEPTAAGAISAFPSMHLAMATLLALLGLRINRCVAAVGIGFCGVILVLSVHLGWHYAVDGYFAIGATIVLWYAVGWAQTRIGSGNSRQSFSEVVARHRKNAEMRY